MAMAQERLSPGNDWAWNPLHTLRSFWGQSGPVGRHLDIGALSEHLQRDMGFLDGNDSGCKRR